MSDSKLIWYWHRLCAMNGTEVLGRCRRKWFQFQDGRRDFNSDAFNASSLDPVFPRLPIPAEAPAVLVAALKKDSERIRAGKWRAFTHLELQIDDPPLWQKDYLARVDVATGQSAFQLDHRALPGGADIKLIWELSRWYELVRLAQAAYLLEDDCAGETCLRWMEDWLRQNPPYRGWNWTSAMESGIRLIQFTWIDALLAARGDEFAARLSNLRHQLLPAHAWFTWRHRSFGSSANNHLLGEMAGLILAGVRWRELQRWSASLDTMQRCWEAEVLAQFAEDGGNREQALNYHLFSFEYCWQTRLALRAAGRQISSPVAERLARAAEFFVDVQVASDPWDYGDSDNGIVTPLFADETKAVQEWQTWMARPGESPSLRFWLGDMPEVAGVDAARVKAKEVELSSRRLLGGGKADWLLYPQSGIAMARSGDWILRFDVSPLGYLSTAAHGHLDALHLSIWRQGEALVVDPGTGAYYADKQVRTYLASWQAHNGPFIPGNEFPERLGPFLWSGHHQQPVVRPGEEGLAAELRVPRGTLRRTIKWLADGEGWTIEDGGDLPADGLLSVRWQFPPGSDLERIGEREFRLRREKSGLLIRVGKGWSDVEMPGTGKGRGGSGLEMRGVCSPAFRALAEGPFLKLTARKPCLLRTTFLAC